MGFRQCAAVGVCLQGGGQGCIGTEGGGALDPGGRGSGGGGGGCQQDSQTYLAPKAPDCFFLHNKTPHLVDPPPCQHRLQCKVNSKAINLWQNLCPQQDSISS